MNSLSKVIVLFAILGIVGAGLFFYPGSPLHVSKIIVVQQTTTDDGADEAMESEPASGAEETNMDMNN